MRFHVPVLVAIALFGSAARATSQEVVLYASEASVRVGAWSIVNDPTAAGGAALANPDAGIAKLGAALADPSSYFELTFEAPGGQPYHLWMRGKAKRDDYANDSVFVQFSDVVSNGAPVFAIGTTSGTTVNLEDCANCGLSGWGWQDNGYGVVGTDLVFAASGTHTIRVQPREDGLTIDQIVLSATRRTTAPGALKKDTTVLPKSNPSAPPPFVTFVRQPFLQQTSSTGTKIVWATREYKQPAVVHAVAGTEAPIVGSATATPYPVNVTGMTSDYVQYEATLEGLRPSTTYTYKLQMAGVDVTTGDGFQTAPDQTGTIRFVAVGDSGVGSAVQGAISSRIAAESFDFALHTGDVVYGDPSGIGAPSYPQYQSWFFDIYSTWLRHHPVYPTIGNHDDRVANAQPYREVFVLPDNGASSGFADHAERFYSFDYGPVHVTVLDSETAFLDTARRDAQVAWLQHDLASTSQPWKVVVFHRPPYSSGTEHGSDLALRDTFGPIFEQRGVALVLNGHDHDYERTVPIKTSSDAGASAVTYIVTGGGGAPLYAVGASSWTAFSKSVSHYVRGQASPCGLSVQAVKSDGVVFDSVSFDRCTPPAPEIVIDASDPAAIAGTEWSLVTDPSVPGPVLRNPDLGLAKSAALAPPGSYVDLPFVAQRGIPYHVWFRMKADKDQYTNDSISVQFSAATDGNGVAVAPFTSAASALPAILEEGSGQGVAGWGWCDTSYGGLAAPIYFASSGPQTLRIQRREDGVSVDQIVISPTKYLTSSPGAPKNDSFRVAKP